MVEYEGAVRLPFCLGAAVRVPKPKEVMMDEIMTEEYMGNGGEERCLFYFGCMRWKCPFTQICAWFLFPFLLFLFCSSLCDSIHTAATCCLRGPDLAEVFQYMKKEEVPRGQGASLKDFHPLFSLFRCLNNNKHCCYRFLNMPLIVPHISLPGFVLSNDIGVYPQSPGAVERNSSLETLQSVTRWDAGTDAEMLRSWTGLGDGIHSSAFCTKLCTYLSPQSSSGWKNQIQLSGCVCLRSPDKWRWRQREPS